ncbi:MAG: hypothetical protein ACFFAJ_07865 [Candidatus Hodarchaeota archaeon]
MSDLSSIAWQIQRKGWEKNLKVLNYQKEYFFTPKIDIFDNPMVLNENMHLLWDDYDYPATDLYDFADTVMEKQFEQWDEIRTNLNYHNEMTLPFMRRVVSNNETTTLHEKLHRHWE